MPDEKDKKIDTNAADSKNAADNAAEPKNAADSKNTAKPFKLIIETRETNGATRIQSLVGEYNKTAGADVGVGEPSDGKKSYSQEKGLWNRAKRVNNTATNSKVELDFKSEDEAKKFLQDSKNKLKKTVDVQNEGGQKVASLGNGKLNDVNGQPITEKDPLSTLKSNPVEYKTPNKRPPVDTSSPENESILQHSLRLRKEMKERKKAIKNDFKEADADYARRVEQATEKRRENPVEAAGDKNTNEQYDVKKPGDADKNDSTDEPSAADSEVPSMAAPGNTGGNGSQGVTAASNEESASSQKETAQSSEEQRKSPTLGS